MVSTEGRVINYMDFKDSLRLDSNQFHQTSI